MNGLIRKEVGLLLPSWLIGLLLTLFIWVLPNDPRPQSTSGVTEILGVFPFFVCPALALMVALSSFGREFSAGTLSLLLAQPMARSRLWRTKTLMLAAALGVMLGVWLLTVAIHFRETMSLPEWNDVHLGATAVLFVLVIYSGGLWTVLFFRQVAAAFGSVLI